MIIHPFCFDFQVAFLIVFSVPDFRWNFQISDKNFDAINSAVVTLSKLKIRFGFPKYLSTHFRLFLWALSGCQKLSYEVKFVPFRNEVSSEQ